MDVPVEGIWTVTPFVTLVLTLAYIGTLTAMIPALSDLRQAEKDLFGSQAYSLFAVDTTKNIVDYLAILQLMPRGRTHTPADDPGTKPWSLRLHHLILPAVFLGSLWTSYSAIRHLAARSADFSTLILTFACLEVQAAYTVRPLWRYVRRLAGADRMEDVYN
jgi:hypothetical protein